MELLLILVEPPQVGSLDPHKYLAVVLIVILDVAGENEPIFSGQSQACIHSLLLNQYFLSLVGPWIPGVLLLLPSSLPAFEDD